MKFGIGQAVRRKEDQRLLRGQGRYTDDINLDGQARAVFLRSPYAHAVIRSIDISMAQEAPGVIAVLTGADAAADGIGEIPCLIEITSRDGRPMNNTRRPVLSRDRVRYVGEPVALVVAETAYQAQDAAEMIMVDFEELPAVTDTAKALEPDAPLVWPEAGTNLCVQWENDAPDAVEAILATAARVVEVSLTNNRLVGNPMEPRAALADYNAETGVYTLYSPTQGAHRMHRTLVNQVFRVPEDKIRVVSPDAGGGFGVRSKVTPEVASLMWAAKRVGRPVKWLSDRSETTVVDNHGRDNVTRAKVGLDADGRILAMWVDNIAAVGAYLSDLAMFPLINVSHRTTGTSYRIPALYHSIRVAFSNTVQVDAYRGASRPEAAFVMESLMEAAGRETGLGPVEIRRRNLVTAAEMPYRKVQGITVDSGDFVGGLETALERSQWSTFDERRRAARERGMLRGIGIGCFLEVSGAAQQEMGRVRVTKDGRVQCFVGTRDYGQGHETVFTQIVAENLGVDYQSIEFHDDSDTDVVDFGNGSTGSRSAQMGGVALLRACRAVVDKARRIAAHSLQQDADALSFEDGSFHAPNGAHMTLAQVAAAAADPDHLPDGMETGLDERLIYDRGEDANTYPNGCHVAEVEVDPGTGMVTVVNYTAVDDNGLLLNPMIVHGQSMGGIIQGLGQALLERTVYDDAGQLLSASFLDYGMPRADVVPPMNLVDRPTLCTTNDLGVKGAGESGTCGAPPAIVNAVVDALKEYGITQLEMPLTPDRVWRAIRDAEVRAA